MTRFGLITPAALASRGFTLIELVVAMAILALTATMMAGAVRYGSRAWDRSRTMTSGLDEVLTAQHALRSRISSLQPFPKSDVVRPVHAVDGTHSEVVFTAPGTEGMAPGGMYRYKVLVEKQGSKADLAIAWRLDRDGAPDELDTAGWRSEPLLTNISDASFQYLGSDSTGLHWQDGWSQEATLPRAIRIIVRFPPADVRRWPDLTVRMRVDSSAICAFDPVSVSCR